MSGNRIGPLAGYRPSASPRNGIPGQKAYAYKNHEGWDPARGVHRDPEAVAPAARSMARPWPGGREGRMAAYADARREGLTRAQAAERIGIAEETSLKYERAYQRGDGS